MLSPVRGRGLGWCAWYEEGSRVDVTGKEGGLPKGGKADKRGGKRGKSSKEGVLREVRPVRET